MFATQKSSAILKAGAAAAVLALAAFGLVGCGGGGGGVAPTAANPGTAGGSDRGGLELSVAFANSSRTVPQIDSLTIYLMGEGMTEYQSTTVTVGGQARASFWDIPVGPKVVLGVGTSYEIGTGTRFQAIGALLAKVQPNTVTKRTLYLDYADGVNTVVNGEKTIGGVPTQVMDWSDGEEDFLAYDRKPPQAGPANVLWYGMFNPDNPNSQPPWPATILFDPPVVIVPDKLEKGVPVTQNNVALKKTDGSTIMTGTSQCTFEGYDALFSSLGSTTNTMAARIRTMFTQTDTTTNPFVHESLDWYAPGQGKIFSLELDPSKTDDQDGRVECVYARVSSASSGWWGESLQPLLPLDNGAGASFVSNCGDGHQVVVDVAVFGLTGVTTTAGSTQLTLSFNLDVDQTGSASTNANLDPANYLVKINGTPVTVTSAAAGQSTNELLVTLATAPAAGDTFDLIVVGGPGKVHAADGTELPNRAPYNNASGVVQ